MNYGLNGRLTVKQETKSNANISQSAGSYVFKSNDHFKNHKKILNLCVTV